MACREFHRVGIRNFSIGEHAMKEALAKSLKRVFDARTLNQIDTDSKDAHPL
jgi:hypothetical protein